MGGEKNSRAGSRLGFKEFFNDTGAFGIESHHWFVDNDQCVKVGAVVNVAGVLFSGDRLQVKLFTVNYNLTTRW